MIGTGLKNASQYFRPPDAAMSAIDREEVFVPRMQSSWSLYQGLRKFCASSLGFRGQLRLPSQHLLQPLACRTRREDFLPKLLLLSSGFALAMPLSQNASMVFIPRSSPSGNASYRLVCNQPVHKLVQFLHPLFLLQ